MAVVPGLSADLQWVGKPIGRSAVCHLAAIFFRRGRAVGMVHLGIHNQHALARNGILHKALPDHSGRGPNR